MNKKSRKAVLGTFSYNSISQCTRFFLKSIYLLLLVCVCDVCECGCPRVTVHMWSRTRDSFPESGLCFHREFQRLTQVIRLTRQAFLPSQPSRCSSFYASSVIPLGAEEVPWAPFQNHHCSSCHSQIGAHIKHRVQELGHGCSALVTKAGALQCSPSDGYTKKELIECARRVSEKVSTDLLGLHVSPPQPSVGGLPL